MTESELRDAAEEFAIAWACDRRDGYWPAGEGEWPKLFAAIGELRAKYVQLLRAKADVCDAYMEWEQSGAYERLHSARAALRALESK